MPEVIHVSTLPKTWLFDIDGTICKHNGYKIDGFDTILPGVEKFINSIPQSDRVILLTSRSESYTEQTESFLKEHHIRYDALIYDLPYGERILMNDMKPSGLKTSIAINTNRDCFPEIEIFEDPNL